MSESSQPTRKVRKARSKLGRGLSALVDQSAISPIQVDSGGVGIERGGEQYPNTTGEVTEVSSDQRVMEIEVTRVVPNPHQPRRVFSQESLEELGESIVEHGLMQPIVVRAGSGGFELIAGERRWRASCHAGQTHIRAIVLDVDDLASAQLALIENIQREDLNAIERGNGFAALARDFGMTQEQIATKMGIARATVANMLRLIELDEEIQGMIVSGQLSAGHGKALLSCQESAHRLVLAKRAAQEQWNVRLLEQAAMQHNGLNEGGEPTGVSIDGNDGQVDRLASVLHDLENRLGEELSTSVKLKTDRSGTKGTIQIAFYDLDHFDGLMHRLGMRNADELKGG
jgi:ParB family transcriptional regulator, chromosome partitioning protein